MKKTLSIIMSAMLAMSGAAAINSSALLIPNEKHTELYNSHVENIGIFIPDVDDSLDVLSSDEKVKNVWLRGKSNSLSTSQWSWYEIEFIRDDSITFSLERRLGERSPNVDQLNERLGYEDLVDIDVSPSHFEIILRFTEEDHELNYMISEKAYSIISEMYEITEVDSCFNHRMFIHTDIQSCFPLINGYSNRDIEYYFLQKEIYDTVDQEMLKEKFKATLNENLQVEFSEDYTEADKLRCFKYFKDNYNTTVHRYETALAGDYILMKADFSSGEINYLNGDANCDGQLTIADAASVLQALGNPDKYSMSKQGGFNADLAGDGLTVMDAIEIQRHITGEKEESS